MRQVLPRSTGDTLVDVGVVHHVGHPASAPPAGVEFRPSTLFPRGLHGPTLAVGNDLVGRSPAFPHHWHPPLSFQSRCERSALCVGSVSHHHGRQPCRSRCSERCSGQKRVPSFFHKFHETEEVPPSPSHLAWLKYAACSLISSTVSLKSGIIGVLTNTSL